MPSFKHIVKTPYKKTFRSSKIEGLFDIQGGEILEKSWDVNMPVEDMTWNIGVIVGPSGAGKTSIGKVAFGAENYHEGYTDWDPDATIIESFSADASVEEITQVLSSVGFSSPPNWLQPFRTLSNGQKFRVEMARVLFDERDVVVVDEYTSVIDRNVAQIGSAAIAKTARRRGKKLVLLSCHYDILDWLEPDWIYYVDTGEFVRGSLRRPKINIEIKRCHYSAWRLFREHHYLSHNLIKHSECYVALVNGHPAGFFAYVREHMRKRKNLIRGHRSVVLPDYQGIGIGNIVTKRLMKYYTEQGFIVTAITSHPAFIAARCRDPDFRLCSKVEYSFFNGLTEMTKSTIDYKRITVSFQYIGNRDSIVESVRLKKNRRLQKRANENLEKLFGLENQNGS
jgi:ABC-type transport system involved in cytochrome c biogenesis ATPase subunit/GNAT superfamily N-acetyltransferase